MSNGQFAGPRGETNEIIEWPARKVTYTFSHATSGDDRFDTAVHAAMIELIADRMKSPNKPDSEDFTASNGVRVCVSWPKIEIHNFHKTPTEDYTLSLRTPDGDGFLKFYSVPIGSEITLKGPERDVD